MKVEVDVLGSRRLQAYGFCGRKATLHHQRVGRCLPPGNQSIKLSVPRVALCNVQHLSACNDDKLTITVLGGARYLAISLLFL